MGKSTITNEAYWNYKYLNKSNGEIDLANDKRRFSWFLHYEHRIIGFIEG
jgi:hypothetical protein